MTITEQIWYHGKGAQQKCYDNNKTKTFFVCRDKSFTDSTGVSKTTKEYSGFDSIDSFLEYRKTIPITEDCFYEQLTGDTLEVYDIDGKYDSKLFQNDLGEPLEQSDIINRFINARLDFNRTITPKPLCKNQFYIKTTPDPKNEKVSFHVVIRNGIKFRTMKDLKAHCMRFYLFLLERGDTTFDKSIYSKNRNIRMIGSHKLGQTERIATRYMDYNEENRICNQRLFYSSYLTGDEEYYETQTEELVDDEEDDIEEEDVEYLKNCDITALESLIVENIKNGKSSLCDVEYKTRLCYKDWFSLIMAFFNNYSTDNERKGFFGRVIELYRHSDEIDYVSRLKDFLATYQTYSELTIKSIHYWARQNKNYEKHFPDELEKFTQRQKIRDWKDKLKKALKVDSSKFPIKYVYQISSLGELSMRQELTLDYIQKLLKSAMTLVCQGGNQYFFLLDTYKCQKNFETVEYYTIQKFSELAKVTGVFDIRVRVINENYENEFNNYNKLTNKEKEKMEEPKPHCIKTLTHSKNGIIVDMVRKNIMTKAIAPVFSPYLYTQPKIDKDYLNIFRGFPYINTEVSPKIYLNSPMRKNITNYLCDGDIKIINYLDYYIADMIQNPAKCPGIMVIFSGAQGTGKDLFSTMIAKMIGSSHACEINSMDALFSRFNSEYQNKLYVRINEISSKGSHFEKAGQLKDVITRDSITIEHKGKEKFTISHCARYFGFSNNETVVNVENTDRRFVMIKTNNDMANNHIYFSKIAPLLDDVTFIKSAFNYYATLDISNFNIRDIPRTVYKTEQKIENLSSPRDFILNYFVYISECKGHKSNDIKIYSGDLYQQYTNYCVKNGITYPYAKKRFISEIAKLPPLEYKVQKDSGKSFRGFRLTPSLVQDAFRKFLSEPELFIEFVEPTTKPTIEETPEEGMPNTGMHFKHQEEKTDILD